MLLSLCLGRTRAEETFSLNALWWLKLTSYHIDFLFLSLAIQKQSLIMNYQHIYIVNGIKSPKCVSKINVQSGSCKLLFPNNSLDDDLIEFSYIPIFYHYSKDLT